MTSIATVSGRVIDFLNPDPEQIILGDLATGLARQPRYTGQTVRTYSVAQHSILVAHLVSSQHRLHALFHDAPEAFICDAPSPMKEAMRVIARMTGHIGSLSPYDVIERTVWKAICRRYDLSPEIPQEVLDADRTAMLIEAPVLQPKGWTHPVWDFARDDERQIGGVHRELLFNLLGLPCSGGPMWMLVVVDELEKRKAAA